MINNKFSKKHFEKIRYFISIALLILILSSCEMINPDEKIPAYISIDTFNLSTILYSQGPNNHNITDVWATVNGNFIGVFELPAEFPVLHDGAVSIILIPGIKKNGIAASRAKYPFYTKYQVDTVLIGTEVLLLEPEVKYRDEIIIDWYENFEDPGISLDTTTSSHVGITDSIANGSNVAKIELKGEFEDFKAESINNYTFPEPGSSLYFEMDYKCNHEFVVGLNIKTSGSLVNQPIMLINPMYHWNKIYIDLSYISTINFNADNYTVYFAVAKKDTVERAEVLIDNIKLIHY